MNHQQLLTDSLLVLRQPTLYLRPQSVDNSVAVDLAKLPASIRSIRPTNVEIEGQCLVIDRYSSASAYGYFACLPGVKPSGMRADFINVRDEKLEGLWFYSTPSR